MGFGGPEAEFLDPYIELHVNMMTTISDIGRWTDLSPEIKFMSVIFSVKIIIFFS